MRINWKGSLKLWERKPVGAECVGGLILNERSRPAQKKSKNLGKAIS